MGLLQTACATYDANLDLVGVYREGHEVLPPIGHILAKAVIEIMLNAEGCFLQASEVPKDDPKTLIPVTEASMGRTSAPCAHPLCDSLAYISRQEEKKNALYIEALENWRASPFTHPFLDAISIYVQNGTVLEDLEKASLIECKNGKTTDLDKFIRWRVVGIETEESACWQNRGLHEQFIKYILSQAANREQEICMVSGKRSVSAYQHAKGVVSLHGNAKLISANDSTNFTYKGRFIKDSEAMNVSYESSQKAHNALRWLVGEQKVYYGNKAFLCWNPNGFEVPKVTDPFGFEENGDNLIDIDIYRDRLRQTLEGYRTSLPEREAIVIASFDAATTGRLSLNFYSELPASEFLKRLYDWDENCCWFHFRNGRENVQSVRLLTIVCCAFGTERSSNGVARMEVDDRVKSQQLLRLVACRINKAPMPADIKEALVHKASTPLSFEPSTRRLILSTACAVIKKYDHDRKGVNWEMALQPNKMDLSYQYGRLLAVLEKAETDTYDRDGFRETNAIRMQTVYVQRPQYAATRILEQLKKAYFPRLSMAGRIFYERLIGEIYAMIDEFPEQEQNRPLQDSYLMGYYLQRNELWRSGKNNDVEQNKEEN